MPQDMRVMRASLPHACQALRRDGQDGSLPSPASLPSASPGIERRGGYLRAPKALGTPSASVFGSEECTLPVDILHGGADRQLGEVCANWGCFHARLPSQSSKHSV